MLFLNEDDQSTNEEFIKISSVSSRVYIASTDSSI